MARTRANDTMKYRRMKDGWRRMESKRLFPKNLQTKMPPCGRNEARHDTRTPPPLEMTVE